MMADNKILTQNMAKMKCSWKMRASLFYRMRFRCPSREISTTLNSLRICGDEGKDLGIFEDGLWRLKIKCLRICGAQGEVCELI